MKRSGVAYSRVAAAVVAAAVLSLSGSPRGSAQGVSDRTLKSTVVGGGSPARTLKLGAPGATSAGPVSPQLHAPAELRVSLAETVLDRDQAAAGRFDSSTPDPVGNLSLVRLLGRLTLDGVPKSGAAAPDRISATIEWTGAARTDLDRKAPFSSPLKSQFTAPPPGPDGPFKIAAGAGLVALGDVAGALGSIRTLFDEGEAAARRDDKDGGGADSNAAGASDTLGEGSGNAQQKALTDVLKNQDQRLGQMEKALAARPGYAPGTKTPSAAASFSASSAAPGSSAAVADIYTTTATGCSPRVDLAAGIAVIQAQLVKNGVADGVCSDTATLYPLQKGYAGCPDTVDAAAGTANASFRRYYTEAAGTTFVDATCQPDPDNVFTLSTTQNGCTWTVDVGTLTATPNTRRIYTDRANSEVVVAGCSPDATGVKTLTKDYTGCAVSIDLAAGNVSLQYKLTYANTSGAVIEAASCAPDPSKTQVIAKDHTSCSDKIDLAAGNAYRQYKRTYTDAAGATQTADPVCQPDSAAAMAISSTATGCSFAVDLVAGTATPFKRKTYIDSKGATIEAEACAPDAGNVQILAKDYTGCADSVDIAGGNAYRQYKLTYTDSTGSTQTADPVCRPDAATAMPITSTPNGCSFAVDLVAGTATPAARKIYAAATGTTIEVAACAADAANAQALQKAYDVCPDKINMAQGQAWPQYRRWYTDDSGAGVLVDTVCQTDTAAPFTIADTAAGCTVALDWSALTATQQVRKTYTNLNGQEITLQACAVVAGSPAGPAAPMTKTTSGCGIRHDFIGMTSYSQSQTIYTLAGVAATAAACGDDGATYAHAEVRDTAICPNIVDLATQVAWSQFRTKITVGVADQWINECQPDTGATQTLVKTAAGCESVFFDYFDLGQTYGAARWYHTLSGTPTYVTACLKDDTAVYAHQLTVGGYQNDDTTKVSYVAYRTWHNSPVGVREIAASFVPAGATAIPYTAAGAIVAATGNISYTGCDKYTEMANYNKYTRGDGTYYQEFISLAAPSGPTNACASVVTWAGLKSGGYSCYETGPCADPSLGNVVISGSCSYDGTNKKTREDGTVVSTTTNTCTSSSSSSTCRWSGVCPTCGGTIDAGTANNCRSTWGWW